MDMLIRYDWPGNVRELMNAVERAVVLARSDYLDTVDMPFISSSVAGEASAPEAVYVGMPLEAVEKSRHSPDPFPPLAAIKARLRAGLGITRKNPSQKT